MNYRQQLNEIIELSSTPQRLNKQLNHAGIGNMRSAKENEQDKFERKQHRKLPKILEKRKKKMESLMSALDEIISFGAR